MDDDGIVRKNGVLDREYYINLIEQEGPDAIPDSILPEIVGGNAKESYVETFILVDSIIGAAVGGTRIVASLTKIGKEVVETVVNKGTRNSIEVINGVRYINGHKAVINPEKQARHLIDTVSGTRSYLDEGIDAQKLLDQYGGTGNFVQSYKEVVDTGKTIGYFVDPVTGVKQATSKITIHYSKTGVHIVPAKP